MGSFLECGKGNSLDRCCVHDKVDICVGSKTGSNSPSSSRSVIRRRIRLDREMEVISLDQSCTIEVHISRMDRVRSDVNCIGIRSYTSKKHRVSWDGSKQILDCDRLSYRCPIRIVDNHEKVLDRRCRQPSLLCNLLVSHV